MGDNVALKNAFVAAVFADEKDRLRTLAHPDFELRQNKALPNYGIYKGADGFLDFLKTFMATFEIEKLDNTRTFTSPDGAVVSEFAFKAKLSAGGALIDTTLIEVWDFRDDKVFRIVTYWFDSPFAA